MKLIVVNQLMSGSLSDKEIGYYNIVLFKSYFVQKRSKVILLKFYLYVAECTEGADVLHWKIYLKKKKMKFITTEISKIV
jgi:hypothetical protein